MATPPVPIAVVPIPLPFPKVSPDLPQTGFPTDEAGIRAALDGIENRLNMYMNDPAAFFVFFGNTIKVDISQYIAFLERRRAELLVQLQNLPSWTDSDMDPNGPMIKQY